MDWGFIFGIIIVSIMFACIALMIIDYNIRTHAFCTEHGFIGAEHNDYCYRYTDGIKEQAEFSCVIFGKCRWIKTVEGDD